MQTPEPDLRPLRWHARLLCVAACLFTLGAHAQLVASLAPMIERVSPAVVNISVTGSVAVDSPLADNPFFRGFIDPEPRPLNGSGSGVIVDAERGFVLTNHHVIENAETISVMLLDKRAIDATVVGSDPGSDLAVLRIAADGLEQMALGDSDRLRVGDFVVAIGNPFGFSHTVTSGIVSGLGRSGINPDRASYEDFIQTDASINPGNSGGALVNLDGELVGINSAIVSRTGGNIGIGFAIPVAMAKYVMDQIIEFGAVQRGLLGVTIQGISPSIAEQYSLSDTAGAYVTDVAPGSAAEAAGLRIEDVIVGVDGRAVDSPDALRNLIGLHRPGDTVRVDFIRDGERASLTATLGSSDDTAALFSPRIQSPPADSAPIIEGVDLAPDQTAAGTAGLRVVAIAPESPAAQAGLRRDDLILRLNRQRVTTLAQARAVVTAAGGGIVALVRRGNRESIVLLP